jgi:hypothetical protein
MSTTILDNPLRFTTEVRQYPVKNRENLKKILRSEATQGVYQQGSRILQMQKKPRLNAKK